MNLINNAKEAMPGGGMITINTLLEDGFLRIDFKDTVLACQKRLSRKY